ncbi:MAG: hypothetical protein F7B19_04465 [Desulfurococcales archaeon]|nr:hypothetical protein [Desulfurococcales archaeon]MCE4627509.1 hypothetical protein [Desulfurococcales archaeon]
MIVNSIKNTWSGYDVERLWYSPPRRIEDALYRQEVFSDLEIPGVLAAIKGFVDLFGEVISKIQYAEKHLPGYQQEGIFLDAVLTYCEAVSTLLDSLSEAPLRSRGLLAFREYLRDYVDSEGFKRLKSEAEDIASEISSLSFCMEIKGLTITIYKSCEGEDYSISLKRLFNRFKPSNNESNVTEPKWRLSRYRGHVEDAILNLVAKIYKEPFKMLSQFYQKNRDFMDAVILQFYHEIQFYLSYLSFIAPLRKAGLPFTLPRLKKEGGEEYCLDCFDLVLATRLLEEGKRVITNDFRITPKKKIIVVTGPNSGGKTTFARMIGQIYYLARLGVPIPGRDAQLFFVDSVYTHFPQGENVENMISRLEEDLVAVKQILDRVTPRSIIILNELFSSTTSYDATRLGRKIIERINKIGSRCVYVTFIDELARLEYVESYVAQVSPDDPKIRTYKILRRPPSGLTYAKLIAKRYRLTYEDVISRVT